MSRDTSPFRQTSARCRARRPEGGTAVSEPVVLINVFEVPVADAEQFVAA
jgi:hypothetical protein